jgi:hypothetical protein
VDDLRRPVVSPARADPERLASLLLNAPERIQPYSGDAYEFHVEGQFMPDAVYKMIEDRIVASRGH